MESYLVPPQAEMATDEEWILACLRSGWEPGVIDTLREGEAIDWEQLLEIAHRERVSPLIYSLARDRGLFPPHVLERLQGVYHQNLVRNTHLMNAAENIVKRMVDEGIPVLLIKGAVPGAPGGDVVVRPTIKA